MTKCISRTSPRTGKWHSALPNWRGPFSHGTSNDITKLKLRQVNNNEKNALAPTDNYKDSPPTCVITIKLE